MKRDQSQDAQTHNRLILKKAEALGIAGRLLIPGDEEFLELTWAGKRIVVNRTRSHRMPLLAGLLAKNKAASNLLFARSGLPVPAYTVVSGPGEEALQFWRAHRLVTVKPLDASRSAGVTIRVRSEDELVGAVRRALVHSDRVMLQKYVHGSDYRVLIVGGRVVGALEYRAASVEGDGKSTLGQLIERLNAEQASRSRRAGAVGSYLPVDVLGGDAAGGPCASGQRSRRRTRGRRAGAPVRAGQYGGKRDQRGAVRQIRRYASGPCARRR
ncbi:ATP-grasp domain-containing protein [Cohnella rhizosphaerae]|uniref:Prokaryotic glutathione synthetase ATP-binding domain-containing protein n=1 Tax=Cohnella rhizosphaerae TaxID=1457232 RepID=A0A9X4KRH6_9BACL|nr:hypothetical protein [Cohnella rhizosphaerae]MDG0809779.1 hypothetical protein [Cohnella rhizosphaerae]